MPKVIIESTDNGTTVYTSKHGTYNAPDHFVYRNAKDESGNVSILTPSRGDTHFDDGVLIEAGLTYAIDLIANQSVVLIAEAGSVNGNFHITEF